jgi:hypothetical protein
MHAPPGLDVWTAAPESQRLVLSNPLWNTGLRLQVPMVDAQPILKEIARLLEECRLEAVLVGNAAAALQGAPVTTLDFDFMFRRAPANIRKLKTLADKLGGRILRPYYPASGLYRLVVEDRGLQLDFMSSLHGIRSFEGLRSRAARTDFGGSTLLVADLRDIIRSKKALGRPRDLAVLEILEATLDEKEKKR